MNPLTSGGSHAWAISDSRTEPSCRAASGDVSDRASEASRMPASCCSPSGGTGGSGAAPGSSASPRTTGTRLPSACTSAVTTR